MSVRIDWLQILNRLGSSYDDPFLFVLPNAGRNLLLAMTDRLTWEATFREAGYDFTDWDELQALVAQTDKGLIEGVSMDELITAIENGFTDLTNALNGLVFPECPDITLQACNSLANGGFPDEPPEEIPEYSTPHPDTEEPTEPSYEEYKCRATHKYMDATRNLIDNLMDLTLQQSPYSWMYDLLTTEEFGNPIYQVLIAIYNFLSSNIYGSVKDDILAAFDRLHDDILCAIFNSETPALAMALIQEIIDADSAGWIVRNLLRMFIIDSTSIEPIWTLDAVDVTGYELVECNCTEFNPDIVWLADWEGAGSTFAIVTQDGNTIHAEGLLMDYGAGRYKWGWVAPSLDGDTLFPGVTIHGIEFVTVEFVMLGTITVKVRGIDIGVPLAGQTVIVHDGTLSGAGYDIEETGTPTSGNWCPAMNPTQISSGAIATAGNITGQPEGTYKIHVDQFYYLDENGERII